MFRPLHTAVSVALVCAPADGLRAASNATSTRQPVMEIVSFKLTQDADETAFLAAARDTEAMLRARGSLIRRFWSRTKTDFGPTSSSGHQWKKLFPLLRQSCKSLILQPLAR